MKSLLNWACAGLFAVGALFAEPAAAQTVDDIIKRGTVQIAVDPSTTVYFTIWAAGVPTQLAPTAPGLAAPPPAG